MNPQWQQGAYNPYAYAQAPRPGYPGQMMAYPGYPQQQMYMPRPMMPGQPPVAPYGYPPPRPLLPPQPRPPPAPAAAMATTAASYAAAAPTAFAAPPTAGASEALPSAALVPMNVFVGKLPLEVHDSFVETLLKQCGSVLKWKRTMDSDTNKPKAFGFCTFSNAEGAMQAVKLLNDFDLEGANILVKVGKKEQVVIDQLVEHRKQTQSAMAGLRAEYAAKPTAPGPATPPPLLKSAADEALLGRIRGFVASVDPKKPVAGPLDLKSPANHAGEPPGGAAFAAANGSNGQQPVSDHDRMIRDEMEKFRSKQAERDREIEEERRRMLHAKIQQQTALAASSLAVSSSSTSTGSLGRGHPSDADEAAVAAESEAKKRRIDDSRAVFVEAAAPAPSSDGNGLSSSSTTSSSLAKPPSRLKPAAGGGMIKLGFGLGATKGLAAPPRLPAASLFATDEKPAPRPLQTLDYSDDEDGAKKKKPPPSPKAKSDEKRRDRQIADRIPNDRAALFAAPVNWAVVKKHGVVQAKLRPWVTKKIAEYLGEEEPTLIDFVTTQLDRRARPEVIIAELALVLEDDANTLVMKLWRVLLFHALKLADGHPAGKAAAT